MKLQRKLFSLLLLNALWLAPVYAQGDASANRDKAEQVTSRMIQKLELTPEQTKKITDIHADYLKELQRLKESAMTKEEKVTAVKRLVKKEDNKMEEVLSETQFDTYVELRNKKMKKYIEKKGLKPKSVDSE